MLRSTLRTRSIFRLNLRSFTSMLVVLGFVLSPSSPALAANSCTLSSGKKSIQHVIYIQFDNTHFLRDNPNVPSDLEQMPHLLNFIQNNGTLMSDDHTALISHTATGILTSLTGVYPDRMGQPASNSFRYFNTDGTTRTGVSFAYWTAPLFDPAGSTTDLTPTMISENGEIAPARWVPFTRAGCDFGAVGTANTILENTAIDIPTVFGAGSPEAADVATNPAQAFADFVGIGVHCAQGSTLCSSANNGKPDLLPDEPGGYTGYNGLFGAKYVNPLIKPSGPMTDLNGNVIKDATNHIGFPGFDGMEATVTLSWVAHMQEAGIPVTYAYISDAHDGRGISGNIHFAPDQARPVTNSSYMTMIQPSASSSIDSLPTVSPRRTACLSLPWTRAITSSAMLPRLPAVTASTPPATTTASVRSTPTFVAWSSPSPAIRSSSPCTPTMPRPSM